MYHIRGSSNKSPLTANDVQTAPGQVLVNVKGPLVQLVGQKLHQNLALRHKHVHVAVQNPLVERRIDQLPVLLPDVR